MCLITSISARNVANNSRASATARYICFTHIRVKSSFSATCTTFRYRQGLRLHSKLHQPNYVQPQRKHLCKLCNKCFSRRRVLLMHIKTHDNVGPQNKYMCTICSKSVASKAYLTVHQRKHTDEKPYVCNVVAKALSRKTS